MMDTTELSKARQEMLEILDERLAKMPEWRAFRAMDKALSVLTGTTTSAIDPAPNCQPARRRGRTPGVPTYADLALEAINGVAAPMPTNDIVKFVAAKRNLDLGDDRIRVNIQTGLSRDKRIDSVPWLGGRAWWHAGQAVPEI